AELARVVHRRSDGNPLFMVAALDHLERLGLIARTDGAFRMTVPLEQVDIGVPETLRQLIDIQVERLSGEEQAALEVASVVGTSFLAPVCAAALEEDPEAFERLYEALSNRNQLVRRAAGPSAGDQPSPSRYEFVHEIYREVLYGRQPAGRRARLHGRVGVVLERLSLERALGVSG